MKPSVEERLKLFNEGLAQLIKDTEIEPIPTLGIGTSAVVAQITLIDIDNPAMLEKYERKRTPVVDEAPANPRAN